MKLVTVVGARPQFIKAAAVSRIIRTRAAVSEKIIHTGQHYDDNMSRVFFSELDIPKPDYNLGVGSGTHGAQTAAMLESIEKVLLEECPDTVLLYGDTNSTLAGALAAVKLNIPIAHVEAGLRSYNRRMPEEINRILTDHASDLLFPPTVAARENLMSEGILENKVELVGDVMYDAALFYSERAKETSHVLHNLSLSPAQYVLATIHRAENVDDPKRLARIFEALVSVSASIPVVMPVHPRTRAAMGHLSVTSNSHGKFIMIDPVGYLDMVMLEKNARIIVTDSGGIQKEAFFHRVPCVTLRGETEWVELVELGWNTLIDPSTDQGISSSIIDQIDSVGKTGAPYGAGDAAARIVDILQNNELCVKPESRR